MDKAAAETLRREVYAAFNDRKFERIVDFTTPDVKLQSPALDIDVEGQDALVGWLQGWADMSSNLKIKVDRAYVAGDHLINYIHGMGTHDGDMQTPWGTLAATGKKFRGTAVETWDMRKGKIASIRSDADLVSMFGQLGYQPGRFDLESRVRRFYDVVNKGAIEEVREMLAPDFINHEHLAGMPAGREGVEDFLETMRTAFPDFRMTVDDIITDRDIAVVRLRLSGTHRGDFMGIAATNKSFEVEAIDVVRFDGDLAAEHWGVTDSMAMFEKLGLIELPLPTAH